MLLAEYDYATDIEVQREEAQKIGISQGAYSAKIETARNLLELKLTKQQIQTATGLSLSEIEKL